VVFIKLTIYYSVEEKTKNLKLNFPYEKRYGSDNGWEEGERSMKGYGKQGVPIPAPVKHETH